MKIYSTISAGGVTVTALIHAIHWIAAESRGEADGCPANSSWIPREQSCYLYLRESVNFTQAKVGCEALGAHLVSISSEEENQFILDFVGRINLYIWIGLFRAMTEICAGNSCKSWMWLDGSDLEYSQWAAGIVPTSIQCSFIYPTGDWDHSRLCSAQRGYVCEQKRVLPSTTPNGCPANLSWTPKSQSCYHYLQENVNFTQAKGGCEGLGANLVSISNVEENQFIVDSVGATNLPIWIGLFRKTTEICAGDSCGGWMWLDGSDQGYSKWAAGVVANSLPCVFMDSQGDWDHGRLCSAVRGYVCEQKRIFPSSTPDSTTTEYLDSYSSGVEGNVDPTMDATMKNDDQSSSYMIIGVIAAIAVTAAFLGVLVYFIKTRRRNEREMRESGAISHTRGASAGSGVYENCGSEVLHGPTEGHDLVCVNSVHLDVVTREDTDIRTIRRNEATGDLSAYEDNQAYEKVNNYSELNPEYTQLKLVQLTDNPETNQGDINVVYANVEQ